MTLLLLLTAAPSRYSPSASTDVRAAATADARRATYRTDVKKLIATSTAYCRRCCFVSFAATATAAAAAAIPVAYAPDSPSASTDVRAAATADASRGATESRSYGTDNNQQQKFVLKKMQSPVAAATEAPSSFHGCSFPLFSFCFS